MSNPFSFDDDEKPKKKSTVRKRDDDDEEDERPKKKARPRDDDDEDEEEIRPKKKVKSRVDDDDEEDEKPNKKSKSRLDDDDDEDEDDDDEDRPKKKKIKKKKSNKGLIIGLAAGGLVFVMLVCGGLGAFLIWGREGGPKEGYQKFARAAENGDWGTVYDRIDNEAQTNMTASLEHYKLDPVKGSTFAGKSGRDLFVSVMKETKKDAEKRSRTSNDNSFTKGTVDRVDQKGDTATVFISINGKTEEIPMIKQEGTWRIHLKSMSQKRTILVFTGG